MMGSDLLYNWTFIDKIDSTEYGFPVVYECEESF